MADFGICRIHILELESLDLEPGVAPTPALLFPRAGRVILLLGHVFNTTLCLSIFLPLQAIFYPSLSWELHCLVTQHHEQIQSFQSLFLFKEMFFKFSFHQITKDSSLKLQAELVSPSWACPGCHHCMLDWYLYSFGCFCVLKILISLQPHGLV